jgi:hypothetical protein
MSKLLSLALVTSVSLVALEINEQSDFYRSGRVVVADFSKHIFDFKQRAIAKAVPPEAVKQAVVKTVETADDGKDFKILDVQVTNADPDYFRNAAYQVIGYGNGYNGNGYNGYRNGNGNGNGYHRNGYYRNGYNGNGYHRNGNGYHRNGYNGNGNGYHYKNGNGYNGNGYHYRNGNGNGYNGGDRPPEVFVCHSKNYHSAGNGKGPVLVLQMVPPPPRG